jgi:lipopolysaccharide/colanic/teichoic acid biosynthesis glycosyltransferase
MLGLRFSREGEVFYLQERIGLNGEPFRIFKFATMLKDSPNIGTKTMTLRGDPRITPLGRYLRITKINELPQLFNVLRGEMSFVGARPLPRASFERYARSVQKRIYTTPPGITGIGSIVFRDEEKLLTLVREQGGDPQQLFTDQIYPYKGQLEVWYQDHASFLTDMKILLLTFWQIIFPSSPLVFRFFPDLPARPEALTIEGLREQCPGATP